MRWVTTKHYPALDRVLLVESCQQSVSQKFLNHLYLHHPAQQVDLLTCFGAPPRGFDPSRGTIYSIHDPAVAQARTRFIGKLAEQNYSVVAIVCSGQPIMTRWKWLAALRMPAKVMIVNEHADYFWLDRFHLPVMRMVLRHRLGLHGTGAGHLIRGILMYPVRLAVLFSFAGFAHARRLLRAR